jgi:hypothetical protein
MWDGLPWCRIPRHVAEAACKMNAHCVLLCDHLLIRTIRATRCHWCSMMLALPCRAALPAWATLLHRAGILAPCLTLLAINYIGLPTQAGFRTSQQLRYRACAKADSEESYQRPQHLTCVAMVYNASHPYIQRDFIWRASHRCSNPIFALNVALKCCGH